MMEYRLDRVRLRGIVRTKQVKHDWSNEIRFATSLGMVAGRPGLGGIGNILGAR